MVVLTIGLVSLAELLAVSLRLQQLGRNETQAVRLAQDKMDELMSLSFGAVGTGVGADARIAIGGSLSADNADHFDVPQDNALVNLPFTRRWLVAAGPDANPDLRVVTIHVIPDGTDSRTKADYELVSIIRRW